MMMRPKIHRAADEKLHFMSSHGECLLGEVQQSGEISKEQHRERLPSVLEMDTGKTSYYTEGMEQVLKTRLTNPEEDFVQAKDLFNGLAVEAMSFVKGRRVDEKKQNDLRIYSSFSQASGEEEYLDLSVDELEFSDVCSHDALINQKIRNFNNDEKILKFVRLIRVNNANSNVVYKSLKMLLKTLKCEKDDLERMQRLSRSGVADVVVKTMRNHLYINNQTVQTLCCRIISLLCYVPDIRVSLMKKGAGPLLVKVIQRYNQSNKVMKDCVPSLNNLCFSEEGNRNSQQIQICFTKLGLFAYFEKMLLSDVIQENVKIEILYTLRSFALYTNEEIFNAQFVTTLMLSGYENVDSKSYCFELFKALSAIFNGAPYRFQDKIVRLGYGELVLALFEAHSESYELIYLVLCLTSSVALGNSNKKLLRKTNLTKKLVSLLNTDKSVFNIRDKHEQALYEGLVRKSLFILNELLMNCKTEVNKGKEHGLVDALKILMSENKTRPALVNECKGTLYILRKNGKVKLSGNKI